MSPSPSSGPAGASTACVDKIGEYYKNNWSIELAKEEKLYLILHINRVCSKNTI